MDYVEALFLICVYLAGLTLIIIVAALIASSMEKLVKKYWR